MAGYSYVFPAHDPKVSDKVKEVGEADPAIVFWTRLHTAFFFRAIDPNNGVLRPLCPPANDDEEREAARDLLKFFKSSRTPRLDSAGKETGNFFLKSEGATLQCDRAMINRLKAHWDAYRKLLLGDQDIELIDVMEAEFKRLEESKAEAEKPKAAADAAPAAGTEPAPDAVPAAAGNGS